ncbi:hypothetical protein ONZ51_g7016 [Trametes cubensis]|uniref:Uncharacterized protein n=1 Tax=Trametes cubensis TaxID=1111947 RepID=A0AAD7TQY3_9APHY|nr:hypothetical protein ONZ51_g7016 [Trametes cubensis]
MDACDSYCWTEMLLLLPPNIRFLFSDDSESYQAYWPPQPVEVPRSREWGYRLPGMGQQSTLWWMRRMGDSKKWMGEDPNEDEWIPSYIRWEVPPPPIARPSSSSTSSSPTASINELERSPATSHAEELSPPVRTQEDSRPRVKNAAVQKPMHNRWREIENVNLLPKVVAKE